MELSELDNLLLNMSAGLLPEHLSQNEINLIEQKYGTNWFYELGYNDTEYKNPKFIELLNDLKKNRGKKDISD